MVFFSFLFSFPFPFFSFFFSFFSSYTFLSFCSCSSLLLRYSPLVLSPLFPSFLLLPRSLSSAASLLSCSPALSSSAASSFFPFFSSSFFFSVFRLTGHQSDTHQRMHVRRGTLGMKQRPMSAAERKAGLAR